jgi:nicotinamide mononucleotide adenylyltransferase
MAAEVKALSNNIAYAQHVRAAARAMEQVYASTPWWRRLFARKAVNHGAAIAVLQSFGIDVEAKTELSHDELWIVGDEFSRRRARRFSWADERRG